MTDVRIHLTRLMSVCVFHLTTSKLSFIYYPFILSSIYYFLRVSLKIFFCSFGSKLFYRKEAILPVPYHVEYLGDKTWEMDNPFPSSVRQPRHIKQNSALLYLISYQPLILSHIYFGIWAIGGFRIFSKKVWRKNK